MGYKIINQDITRVKADILVNESNGIGFMGGLIGKYIKTKGVAEAIHYATKGAVEKEAKRACKKKANSCRDGYVAIKREKFL